MGRTVYKYVPAPLSMRAAAAIVPGANVAVRADCFATVYRYKYNLKR
jgi:hypothetical protein